MKSRPLCSVGLFLLLSGSVTSQGTDATCTTDTWTANSVGQSICLIAAYLQGACDASVSDGYINSLGGGFTYYTQPSSPSKCTCNMVFYNAISACGECQGFGALTWTSWISPCPSSMIAGVVFPAPIPAGTAIPAWVYMISNPMFDIGKANTYWQQNKTEITAAGLSSPSSSTSSILSSSSSSSAISSSASSTGATSSTSSSASAQPSASPSSSNGKSSAGGIIGGVLGGVASIAGAIGAYYKFQKSKRDKRASSATATNTNVVSVHVHNHAGFVKAGMEHEREKLVRDNMHMDNADV